MHSSHVRSLIISYDYPFLNTKALHVNLLARSEVTSVWSEVTFVWSELTSIMERSDFWMGRTDWGRYNHGAK